MKSNIGGWHSPFFDLKNKDNIGLKFLLSIQKYVIMYSNPIGYMMIRKFTTLECGQ